LLAWLLPHQTSCGSAGAAAVSWHRFGCLLAFAPVGELHAPKLRRVGIRGQLEHGLIGPRAPAQLERRGDQPLHVWLGQVAAIGLGDGPDRARRVPGRPGQGFHGQPPHPGLVRRPDHADAHLPGPDVARQAAVRLVGHHHRSVPEPPPDQFLHRAPALHNRLLQPTAGHAHHPAILATRDTPCDLEGRDDVRTRGRDEESISGADETAATSRPQRAAHWRSSTRWLPVSCSSVEMRAQMPQPG
jgi:hypothetical protein